MGRADLQLHSDLGDGLASPEAGSTAGMMLLHVVAEAGREADETPIEAGRPARAKERVSFWPTIRATPVTGWAPIF